MDSKNKKDEVLYDHNRDLCRQERGPRLFPQRGQTEYADNLRHRRVRGARIRHQVDCGTIRSHERPDPLGKPFNGQSRCAGIIFFPLDAERQALPGAGRQVARPLGLHTHVADMWDLRPHEYPVHVIGAALKGGEVANPQGVFPFVFQFSN